jgi:conjugal transfer pilus assembly protein TraV
MSTRMIIPLAVAVALSGCGSMTGLTESTKFACKAPAGTTCTSVSGVYANTAENSMHPRPAQVRGDIPSSQTAKLPAGAAAFPVLAPGMPIRSQARMLRIWVAPWRDDDDTLHDQSYMYVMVDPGKWLVERSREATVQRTMTRLQPLGKQRAAAVKSPQDPPSSGGQLANVRNNAEAQQSAREAAVVPADSGEAQ